MTIYIGNTQKNLHMYTFLNVYRYILICIYIYVYTYIYMRKCMWICIYT